MAIKATYTFDDASLNVDNAYVRIETASISVVSNTCYFRLAIYASENDRNGNKTPIEHILINAPFGDEKDINITTLSEDTNNLIKLGYVYLKSNLPKNLTNPVDALGD